MLPFIRRSAVEKKHLLRVEMLRAELKRRLGETLESGDGGKIAAVANLVKLMGIALAPLDANAEVDPATLTLTVQQVAQALGFHPEHVRRLLRSGALAGERAGRDYQVALPTLIAWLDQSKGPTMSDVPLHLMSQHYTRAEPDMLSHLLLDKEANFWDAFTRSMRAGWRSPGQQQEPSSGEDDIAQEGGA
jgi:excisionase family DNA binding protein